MENEYHNIRGQTLSKTPVIKETRKNYDNMSNQILWEICKIKIKEESTAYCKQKQMIRKNVRAGLEKQISETEEKIIATNYNNNRLIEKRDTLTQELHDMIQQQNKGAQIRSRAKWIEEGEKSTKYFFNLEKSNSVNNTIFSLKKDGSYTTSDTEILQEQYISTKNCILKTIFLK